MEFKYQFRIMYAWMDLADVSFDKGLVESVNSFDGLHI